MLRAIARTPGVTTKVNVRMQRNQLPAQDHKIIFVNTDVPKDIPPTSIYDTADADAKARPRSNAGRMMAAALMLSQEVDVEMVTQVGLRDDVLCDPYNASFALPLGADGTASITVFYNYEGDLKQATISVSASATTAYAFLGESQPSPEKEIVGCALLVGRLQADDTVAFSIHGFTDAADFDDEQYNAVDVLLGLKPYLTREEIEIEKRFDFVDVLPADQAGMTSNEGDIYPYLEEEFVNSCSRLVILTPEGDGNPDPDGGNGDGDGGGADNGNEDVKYYLQWELTYRVYYVEEGDENASSEYYNKIAKFNSFASLKSFMESRIATRITHYKFPVFNNDTTFEYIGNQRARFKSILGTPRTEFEPFPSGITKELLYGDKTEVPSTTSRYAMVEGYLWIEADYEVIDRGSKSIRVADFGEFMVRAVYELPER